MAEAFPERDRIIRFRHVLVHGYDTLDYDIVWTIVHDKLPNLETDIVQALKALDNNA